MTPPAGFVARYRKGIVAVLWALATVGAAVLTGGGWSTVDWIAVVSGVLGAFGVVLVPNAPKAP